MTATTLKDFLHLTTQSALVSAEICFGDYYEDVLRHLRAAQAAAVLCHEVKNKKLFNMTRGVVVTEGE